MSMRGASKFTLTPGRDLARVRGLAVELHGAIDLGEVELGLARDVEGVVADGEVGLRLRELVEPVLTEVSELHLGLARDLDALLAGQRDGELVLVGGLRIDDLGADPADRERGVQRGRGAARIAWRDGQLVERRRDDVDPIQAGALEPVQPDADVPRDATFGGGVGQCCILGREDELAGFVGVDGHDLEEAEAREHDDLVGDE
ncbi:MAG: hypothetical protein JNJ59_20480 [Deltaproteobacteria bacterium]|nr:hypothetical protein [Deltaproteobacteria bacterium]